MATFSSCAVTYSLVFHVQMLQEGFYHSDPHPGEQGALRATAAYVRLSARSSNVTFMGIDERCHGGREPV